MTSAARSYLVFWAEGDICRSVSCAAPGGKIAGENTMAASSGLSGLRGRAALPEWARSARRGRNFPWYFESVAHGFLSVRLCDGQAVQDLSGRQAGAEGYTPVVSAGRKNRRGRPQRRGQIDAPAYHGGR